MRIQNNKIEDLGPVAEGWNEPVTVESVIDHAPLNVALEAVETLLQGFITDARQQFEHDTDGRICLPTTFRQHLTCWPDIIRLERGKVLSVTSITYFDANDEPQELEGYELDKTGIPALVYLPNFNYPALSSKKARPITVEFVAGWANAAAVPEDVKRGIRALSCEYWNQRSATSSTTSNEVAYGFARLCSKYATGLRGF